MDKNNYVIVKDKTLFYYVNGFVRILGFLADVLFVLNILYIVAHTSLRIYQGKNLYTEFLFDYAYVIAPSAVLFIILFALYLSVINAKHRAFFMLTPLIFLIITYYLSGIMYGAFGFLGTAPGLVVLSIFFAKVDNATKGIKYKHKKMEYVGNPARMAVK